MFTTRSLLLKNQEVKKWLGKNHHKNCLVINLSLYLLWPAIVWKPLSCFDLQDLMIFSQTFPHKNKVRVFIPFYVSSVFNKNIVQSTREGVRYRVSPLVRGLEIDIWGGLITSSLHFLMDPDFSVWFCDEYFQCWRQSWQNSCYCRCRSCVMRALHLGGLQYWHQCTVSTIEIWYKIPCYPWQLVVGFNCSILKFKSSSRHLDVKIGDHSLQHCRPLDGDTGAAAD